MKNICMQWQEPWTSRWVYWSILNSKGEKSNTEFAITDYLPFRDLNDLLSYTVKYNIYIYIYIIWQIWPFNFKGRLSAVILDTVNSLSETFDFCLFYLFTCTWSWCSPKPKPDSSHVSIVSDVTFDFVTFLILIRDYNFFSI